jgi:hypothetical protein
MRTLYGKFKGYNEISQSFLNWMSYLKEHLELFTKAFHRFFMFFLILEIFSLKIISKYFRWK